MKKGKNYTVQFKRKREQRTDYKARLSLLASRKPRLVVRRTLNNIILQIIDFEPKGDKTLVSTNTRELLKYGWKGHKGNLPSAYLSGYLCGLKAKKKGIKTVVLDLGLLKAIPGSSPFAAVKGATDAGLHVPHDKEILPKEESVKGQHISLYAKKLSKEHYEKQFSKTIKHGLNIQEFPKHVEEVKQKITTQWQ